MVNPSSPYWENLDLLRFLLTHKLIYDAAKWQPLEVNAVA